MKTKIKFIPNQDFKTLLEKAGIDVVQMRSKYEPSFQVKSRSGSTATIKNGYFISVDTNAGCFAPETPFKVIKQHFLNWQNETC